MKRISLVTLCLCCLIVTPRVLAQDGKKAATGHEWLHQLVGEWTYDAEATMEPGKPPMKMKGSESSRQVGDHWVQMENKGEVFGKPFVGILTVGFDDDKKKYVGTWIDSMNPTMMKYEGDLDSAGKVLTLNTSGPSPMDPNKICKFKDIIEVKSKDEKTLTSQMQKDDGTWVQFMTIKYQRKK
jgi:hypothetical protein